MLELAKKLKAKPVWTTGELSSLLGMKKTAAAVYAQRLMKKEILFPIKRGIYSVSEEPLAYATHLAADSYVSFLSALSIHHATTQIPVRVQVVVPIIPKFESNNISWACFPRDKIFGYSTIRIYGYPLQVAELEKAVADIAYRPREAALHFAYDAIRDCEPKKLMEYARRMGKAATRRVGYMLDTAGIQTEADTKTGVTSFNPAARKKGVFNSKWRIYANEALKDADI